MRRQPIATSHSHTIITAFAITVAFLVLSNASYADTVIIDFDDGTQDTSINAFYNSLGVTFENGQWQDVLLPPFDGIDDQLGASLPFVITAVNTASGLSTFIDEENAIIGIFTTPVNSQTIRAGDVGVYGARMNAYDAPVGGNLIGFDEISGVGAGTGNFQTLTVDTPSILRFELFQPNITGDGDGDGVWFDNLSFTPVPLPAAVWLLGSALLGLVGIVRRNEPA